MMLKILTGRKSKKDLAWSRLPRVAALYENVMQLEIALRENGPGKVRGFSQMFSISERKKEMGTVFLK